MPKSRVRRKAVYTPPPTRSASKRPSPAWFGVLILVLFLVGIAWLVTYYVSGGNAPVIRWFGGWNLVIGFAFLVTGLGLATRWR